MPATLEFKRPRTRPAVHPAPVVKRSVSTETPDSAAPITPALSKPGKRRKLYVSFSPGKLFTWFGFAIAAGLVTAFGSDLMFGWPFWRASVLFDATFVACGVGLAWLSWSVRRDQIRGR